MWLLFAVGASVFWGITYVINEQVYKHISVLSSIAITLAASGLFVGLVALATGTFGKDIATLSASPKVLWLLIAGIAVLTIAELLIGFSIVGKNATIAGLIEISYPLFIVLFSYLLFKESNLSVATVVGGAFVFIGVGVIYAFNR
jgi:drug/metabolite transporter (DMT)-like permease